MEIRIPGLLLGLIDHVDFEFKRLDNMQEESNTVDFYGNEDVAPAGRFN